ncbi:hypothetical protein MY8738_001199 [Beauveria namnaoensis]
MQTSKALGYRSRETAAGTTMREDYDRYSKEAEKLSEYLKGIRLWQILKEFYIKIHLQEIDRQLRGIKPGEHPLRWFPQRSPCTGFRSAGP